MKIQYTKKTDAHGLITIRIKSVDIGCDAGDIKLIDALVNAIDDTGVFSHFAIEYSADGEDWHSVCTADDIYMHTSDDNGETWGDAVLMHGDTDDNNEETPQEPGEQEPGEQEPGDDTPQESVKPSGKVEGGN